MAIKLDDTIEWPNGEGFTPCSSEYARLIDAMDAIKPEDVNLDDLSAEDYELWNRLDDKKYSMLAEGHLGKSVRYGS
jgi:hypothetical protein